MVFVFLSILFFFFQNIANKEYSAFFPSDVKTFAPFHVFSHAAMILSLLFFGSSMRLPFVGYVYAFIYAIAFLCAIIMLMRTLSIGPIGKTTLIVNLSLLIPVLLGVLFWDEKLNTFNLIGIPCVILTLVLSVPSPKTTDQKSSLKWTLSVLITFFLDGLLSVIQQLFLRACSNAYSSAFVLVSAVFGLVICLFACAFFYIKDKRICLPRKNKLALFVLIAIIVGASTGIATMFNMDALSLIDGVIVFPVRQGGLILMITLYGIIRYKDKFDLKTGLMLLSGIAGIILMNL